MTTPEDAWQEVATRLLFALEGLRERRGLPIDYADQYFDAIDRYDALREQTQEQG